LVFKEAPELIYTGLTKAIGKPRDLEKNLEETVYFDSKLDIEIPINNTHEYSAEE
jgi:hypothetical protein